MLKKYRNILLTFVFVSCISFLSGQEILNQKLDFIIEDLSIPEALIILSEASETEISFAPELLDQNKLISLHEINVPISRVIDKCLKGQNVEYLAIENKIVVRSVSFEPYALSGYVYSKESGEPISGVNITNDNGEGIVVTNAYGFYSVNIEKANELITYKHENTETETVALFEIKNRLDVELMNSELRSSFKKDSSLINNEANQQALPQRIFSNSTAINIDNFERKNSLSFLNEPLSSRSYWGGVYDHQAVYLDDIKLFRPKHVFNQQFSYNPRLARHAEHQQENISAKYAGNLSAVTEVHTKIGSFKNLGIDIGLNNYLGNATIDFPIVKNKLSILVSARGSFQDPWRQGWLKQSKRELKFNETVHDLTDQYFKLNWKPKWKHLIQLSYFNQTDDLRNLSSQDSTFLEGPFDEEILININDTTYINNQQSIAAISWRYAANTKLFLKTTISLSQLNDQSLTSTFGRGQRDLSSAVYRLRSLNNSRSKIEQSEARIDVDYFHNQKHHIRFGTQVDLRKISPGIIVQNQELSHSPLVQPQIFRDSIFDENTEMRIYVEDIININRITLNLGLSLGGLATSENNYFSAEPRVKLDYNISDHSKISLSAMMNNQYFHFLSYEDIQAPTDLLISSNFNNPAETAIQQSLKYQQKIGAFSSITLGIFNKGLKSLSRWSDNDFLIVNSGYIHSTNWSNFISYYDESIQGADLNYCYQNYIIQSNIRLSATNSQKKFDSKFENAVPNQMTYMLATDANIALSPRLILGFTWLLKKGLNAEQFLEQDNETVLSYYTSEEQDNPITNLNDYHRLDASLFYILEKNNARHEISLNIFNVYNQRNEVYAFKDKDNTQFTTVVMGQSFYPTIGYQYTWRNTK